MRRGTGHSMAPAETPSGNVNCISGATPASPGLRQYVCQPGARRSRKPTWNGLPAATLSTSETSDAVSRGLVTRLLSIAPAGTVHHASRQTRMALSSRGIDVPEKRNSCAYGEDAPDEHHTA